MKRKEEKKKCDGNKILKFYFNDRQSISLISSFQLYVFPHLAFIESFSLSLYHLCEADSTKSRRLQRPILFGGTGVF